MSRFTVLVSESYADLQGVSHPQTVRFTVVVWGKLAELAARLLGAGSEVQVEGKLVPREVQKEGKWIQTIEILARTLKPCNDHGSGQLTLPFLTPRMK